MAFVLSAQENINYQPFYKQFTVDDGLPSNEVYHVFQDSKGYIWFATCNGVSRYDGEKFQNYDMNNGLVDNVVFEIYEDYKGRIWFVSYTCMLCYYENGSIKPFRHNHLIRNNVRNVLGPVKMSFRVDSLDNVTLSVKCFGLVTISEEGVFRIYDDGIFDDGNVVVDGRNGDAILSSSRRNGKNMIVYFDEDTSLQFGRTTESSRCVQQVFCTRTHDSSILLYYYERVVKVSQGKIRQLEKIKDAIWISEDSNHKIWVSFASGGVGVFPDVDKDPETILFKDSRILSVLQDSEGAYWFTSQSDGVFYVPSYKVKIMTDKDGLQNNRIAQLLYCNNKLFIGYEKSFIDIIGSDGIKPIKEGLHTPESYSKMLYFDSSSNGVLAGSINNEANITWIGDNQVKVFLKSDFYPRSIVKSKKGGYWLAHKYGIDRYVNGSKVYSSIESSDFFADVSIILEDSRGDVWFSTIDGLWNFDGSNFKSLGETDSLLARRSYSMFFHPVDSSLWMATNGFGIVVHEKNGKTWNITTDEGLKSNTVNSMVYSPYGIWAATSHGLSLIKGLDFDNLAVESFSMSDGMPSNELTSIAVSGDSVFVGSNNGLAFFNRHHLVKNVQPPLVYITDLIVDGQDNMPSVSTEYVQLNYYQNTLSIKYIGLAYKNVERTMYRYRMLGSDSSWTYTTSTNCIYMGMDPGTYTFHVQCCNSGGVWSNEGAKIKIVITPPFWATAYFIIAVALLATFLMFELYRIRVKSIDKRSKLVNSVNLYKQQSLRQQMNPHFIFNTLGSIQYYMLNNDSVNSQKYLTKFALLMRMTLDNSMTPVIKLKDEVESLRTYLELEAFRLEDKFTYSIDCPNFDDIKDMEVPTLLIQPFVENSIWHGIMLKPTQEGYVNIKIDDTSTYITIEIDDDGIGRQEARIIREKSSDKNRRSRGYQITQQRINLLNTMYGKKFNIRTIDKYDANNNSLGTTVTISIPKGIVFDDLDYDLLN